VGGTALALLIGHRISVDIDLFTAQPFDASWTASALTRQYNDVEDLRIIKNSIFCHIHDIKVDFISHEYPLIRPVQYPDGIRMLSLEDIGAMKLHAIVNSGDRLKDFVDIYVLLEHLPLNKLYDAYEKKYYPNVNRQMARAALLYYEEIDFSYPLSLLDKKLDWKTVQARLKSAVLDPYLKI
jgi:hypothetical protein